MKLPSKFQIGENVLFKCSYPPGTKHFPGEICKVEFGKYSDGHEQTRYSVKTAIGVYHGQLESQIQKVSATFMGLTIEKIRNDKSETIYYIDGQEIYYHTISNLFHWAKELNVESITVFGKTFSLINLEKFLEKLMNLETKKTT